MQKVLASLGVLFPVVLAYGGCVTDEASPPSGLVLDGATVDVAVGDVATTSDASSGKDVATEDVVTVDAPADAADASIDAAPSNGCADGTREGLLLATYPGVAACGGVWSGHVANAAALCASGWHVCTGAEPALNAVTYDDAVAVSGCFAMNAAQDNFVCYADCAAAVAASVDTAENVDMGAIGAACPYKFPSTGSCISGGRIDWSENSGTGCDFAAGLTGVVCCADLPADAGAGDAADAGDGDAADAFDASDSG